jgi:hypothetical protein
VKTWNTLVPVVAMVRADSAQAAVDGLSEQLRAGGFEPYLSGTPLPDAFESELDKPEITVTVEGREYPVLADGDAVCPECGAGRSPWRIADHMASEHGDDEDGPCAEGEEG